MPEDVSRLERETLEVYRGSKEQTCNPDESPIKSGSSLRDESKGTKEFGAKRPGLILSFFGNSRISQEREFNPD